MTGESWWATIACFGTDKNNENDFAENDFQFHSKLTKFVAINQFNFRKWLMANKLYNSLSVVKTDFMLINWPERNKKGF